LIELMEMGDLPSHPPVVKVFDFAPQMHEIAAGPRRRAQNQAGSSSMGFSLPCPIVSACTYKSIM
jgi:hypothetical protein